MKAGTGRGKRPIGEEVKALFLLSMRLKAEIYSLPQLRSVLHNVNFLVEGLHESCEDLELTTSLTYEYIHLIDYFFSSIFMTINRFSLKVSKP